MSRAKWLLLLLLNELSPIKAQKEDSSESASGEWKPVKLAKECDVGKNLAPHEDNLGQTDLFPWLGVLKIHIHMKGLLQVALSGIVLVKRGHAVGNADEISRIPKTIFKEHSTAMFLATTNEPWYCKLKDYMVHPEYDFATLNTIALIELEASAGNFPMMPICWPTYSYNASKNLYAMGFQDDNKILEKKIFAMDFVDTGLCEEFYNRVGFKTPDVTTAPTHLVCGSAPRNRNSCVWDNGMVLASNTTGIWMLLGLGIRGPGCAAPARFIEMYHYLPWIESAMGLNEIDDQFSRRRNADAVPDPSPLVIDKANESVLYIKNSADTEDICNGLHNELIFQEKKKLSAPSDGDKNAIYSVIYKISFHVRNTTSFCCKVMLNDEKHNAAIYTVKRKEEAEFKMIDAFKIIIPPDDPKIPEEGILDWEPWIKAEDLKEQQPSDKKAFDTFVRLEFEDKAEVEIQVFRPRQGLSASGIINQSRKVGTNKPSIFNEGMNVKEFKAFEDFSAEVRRMDAQLELKTNTSMEVNSKDNKKTILRVVEPYKNNEKKIYSNKNYETTDKNKLKFNTPLDMDLDHYDAVRIPENKLAVIVDKRSDSKLENFSSSSFNNFTKTHFVDENIAEVIESNTKHTSTESDTTEFSNNPFEISVTQEIEVTSIKNPDIAEKSIFKTIKSSSSDNIDTVDKNPKESALIRGKGLVSEAKELKCILLLIFIEAFVLRIAIEI